MHRNCGNKHAVTHGESNTRLFKLWCGVVQRTVGSKKELYVCNDICEEWLTYENFKGWSLQNGYYDDGTGHSGTNASIDRIDHDRGYHPDNCQWIPLSENIGKKTKDDKQQITQLKKQLVRQSFELHPVYV